MLAFYMVFKEKEVWVEPQDVEWTNYMPGFSKESTEIQYQGEIVQVDARKEDIRRVLDQVIDRN